MYKNRILLLSLLSVFFIAGKAKAQESILPDVSYTYLQKLIDTAKKYYPEVRIRAVQSDIALTSYHKEQISWLDVITPSYLFNPSNSTNLVTPTAFNSYQLAVTINLGTFFAKPYTIRNAKRAYTVAQLQQQEYNLTIEANVKRLYIAYIAAQGNLRVLTKAVQDALSNADQLKHKFEKAETTLTEYNAAQVVLYTQNTNKIAGEQAVLTAKVNLEEFVGKRLEDIR